MNSSNRISPLPTELQAELALMSPEDQAALVEAWMLAGDAPVVPVTSKNAAWRSVEAATRETKDRRPERHTALRLVFSRSFAVAASVLVLVAVAVVLQPWNVRYEGAEGVTFTAVSLPDGSSVQLSPGSSLVHRRWFQDDLRKVRLDGEAYFDVSHDGRRFEIETFSAEIEVLGTAFNVRAWSSEQNAVTSVELERGSVEVASRRLPEMSVRLAPGERTLVSGGSVPTPPESMDITAIALWRSGGMSFSNAPIGNVLDEISRRFQVRITAPEDIRLAPVSFFRHSSATVEELLGDLADTAGLRFRRTAQGFEVFVP